MCTVNLHVRNQASLKYLSVSWVSYEVFSYINHLVLVIRYIRSVIVCSLKTFLIMDVQSECVCVCVHVLYS